MSKQKKSKYVAVGGQALMEGVMMTGPSGTAIALRLPDQTIETSMKEFKRIKNRIKFLGFPFIRGIVNMVESQVFGYKCLMESAEKTSMDMENTVQESKLDKWISDHFGPKMMSAIGIISAVLGLGLAFLLFSVLPSLVFNGVGSLIAADITPFKALVEGVIRVALFVLYMYAVSTVKEIKRVVQYHGAEHKSIFCFENKLELTVENVRKQKRFHPRCGTSFLFLTILLSIAISALTLTIFPSLAKPENTALWIAVKLLLLPVILSVGYESIMLAGKYPNVFTKILSAPGLWMQRITTKEPDDSMIEVAIAALNASLGVLPQAETEQEKEDKTPELFEKPTAESEEEPQDEAEEEKTPDIGGLAGGAVPT